MAETFFIKSVRNMLPGQSVYLDLELPGDMVKLTDPVAAIEIKLSNAPKLSRGNTIALEDINAPANYIITPSSEDFPISDKTRVCSLNTFINKYLVPLTSE